jgi:hypothetical protein
LSQSFPSSLPFLPEALPCTQASSMAAKVTTTKSSFYCCLERNLPNSQFIRVESARELTLFRMPGLPWGVPACHWD